MTTATAPIVIDPYAPAPPEPAWRFLHHLNPLSKIGAVAPAMLVLIMVRDLATPAAFLALGYLIVLFGARLRLRTAALMFLGMPIGIIAIGLGFSLWVDTGIVDNTASLFRIGDWTLYSGALQIGFATALRLAAILALALIGGLTTTGPDLVRASIQQLHVPYRIGYSALAAYRFVPRFGYELSVIRAAHRIRGHHGGRGPFARLARGWGYIVPLLAGAIRHAERVALAMDSRAFGAYPTRTERYLVPFRARDWVFIAAFVAASVVLFIVFFPWQA
ncbi:Transmembrane component YkoC of energizing module of thiamin-regulated ECF transporter for HydroxyMethylPyrimidine [Microbacterium esteraromaticum]|uniref:Transmembrane component YkoC of energizing module of thiamin-regulated ECF transporter for HydroxyMethylPyrimidine n=1 Tax=Microbacterium esteraromaticum TaxID=57043 RepID=A0A1R4KPU4_9MICO|nr:energy-coupling factor transporter transmembrane component T [Microbacterium esteraromaticum]SJN46308.1 Transmembrane component YkoC of energizing module of thiamin-regulated ECF transporter for HydroxyMethylPyrimidine [Microbacterium esteraromaticum]